MSRRYLYLKVVDTEFIIMDDTPENEIKGSLQFPSEKVFELSYAIDTNTGKPTTRVVRLDTAPLIGKSVSFNHSMVVYESELDPVKNANTIKMIEQTNTQISAKNANIVLPK